MFSCCDGISVRHSKNIAQCYCGALTGTGLSDLWTFRHKIQICTVTAGSASVLTVRVSIGGL